MTCASKPFKPPSVTRIRTSLNSSKSHRGTRCCLTSGLHKNIPHVASDSQSRGGERIPVLKMWRTPVNKLDEFATRRASMSLSGWDPDAINLMTGRVNDSPLLTYWNWNLRTFTTSEGSRQNLRATNTIWSRHSRHGVVQLVHIRSV